MKNSHSALGKNQLYVFDLLSDLSFGRNVQDIRYYGGSVSKRERCISIGRHCSLFYDIPWWVVDVRHASALFKKAHGDRLGYSCLRTFNRAIHNLIQKGYIIPVATKIIAQGSYEDLLKRTQESPNIPDENLRFVLVNIPDA